jgi:alkanesulfonate monooxygenase SsuD/methylene tetrahydromethanopterin reductase-like flavin-dependent oxidoreductase (luciferase family)
MHVGYTAIFQNPNQSISDYDLYQKDMAIAKLAADSGFQSVWGIEHHFTDYIMNPNVTQFLAYMAGYNPNIKVGTMVVVMPWYPAIRIAETMAQLDAMSDGRALFGFGRGLSRIEFEGLQLDMGESTDRMIETAEAVMQGLEQGYVEANGKFIKQPKARIRPEPFKSFTDRIYAPSISPNSASIMAKLGAGVLIIPQKPWDVHIQDLRKYEKIFKETHNRNPPKPIITSYTVCHADAGKAKDMAAKYIGGYWKEVVKHYEFTGDHFAKTSGYEYYAEVAQKLQAEGADGLTEFFMELQVYGTPQQCYDRVKNIHGHTDCCASIHAFSFGGMPYEESANSLRLFSKEVMPELRKLGSEPAFDSGGLTEPAFQLAKTA